MSVSGDYWGVVSKGQGAWEPPCHGESRAREEEIIQLLSPHCLWVRGGVVGGREEWGGGRKREVRGDDRRE